MQWMSHRYEKRQHFPFVLHWTFHCLSSSLPPLMTVVNNLCHVLLGFRPLLNFSFRFSYAHSLLFSFSFIRLCFDLLPLLGFSLHLFTMQLITSTWKYNSIIVEIKFEFGVLEVVMTWKDWCWCHDAKFFLTDLFYYFYPCRHSTTPWFTHWEVCRSGSQATNSAPLLPWTLSATGHGRLWCSQQTQPGCQLFKRSM